MPSPERRWWARFENEAAACPACRSSRIRMLDVFSIPRTPERRRLAFISGCQACGVLFVNPLPTASQLQKYYSEQGTWAERQSDRVKEPKSVTAGPRRPDRLMSALEPHAPRLASPGKVLDFGCGDGKFLNRMKARGWDTYGIEPSTDAAFRKHHRLLEVPQDGSFDFVVLNHVLEHLLDPLNTLQQLAGSLRDGGILFVSTPRLDTLPLHRDLKVLPQRPPACGELFRDLPPGAAGEGGVRQRSRASTRTRSTRPLPRGSRCGCVSSPRGRRGPRRCRRGRCQPRSAR